jgi:hypothetical protein
MVSIPVVDLEFFLRSAHCALFEITCFGDLPVIHVFIKLWEYLNLLILSGLLMHCFLWYTKSGRKRESFSAARRIAPPPVKLSECPGN